MRCGLGFPEIRGAFMGAPTIRIIEFGLCSGL